jgi:hypothetical protein
MMQPMADEHAQQQPDEANAEFWSEPCRTDLALAVGVTDALAEGLARSDPGYPDMNAYDTRARDGARAGNGPPTD